MLSKMSVSLFYLHLLDQHFSPPRSRLDPAFCSSSSFIVGQDSFGMSPTSGPPNNPDPVEVLNYKQWVTHFSPLLHFKNQATNGQGFFPLFSAHIASGRNVATCQCQKNYQTCKPFHFFVSSFSSLSSFLTLILMYCVAFVKY